MIFNSIDELKDDGFEGFITIAELNKDSTHIPKTMGIYLVIFKGDKRPAFVEQGTGGFYKSKDPNKSIDFLSNKWVENTIILYIGKAGGDGMQETLNDRIKCYLSFGRGNKVAHSGGRLIWQIKNSKDLVISWKPLINDNPIVYEKKLRNSFKDKYGTLPFANLQH